MRVKNHEYANEEEAYVAAQAAAGGPLPDLPKELLDELVKGPMAPNEVQDLKLAFNKAIIKRAIGAEMTMHLGHRLGEADLPQLFKGPHP